MLCLTGAGVRIQNETRVRGSGQGNRKQGFVGESKKAAGGASVNSPRLSAILIAVEDHLIGRWYPDTHMGLFFSNFSASV